MEMDKNVLSRIKEILKGNPRGMNVTEIVSEIRMNRQSVSKYLEMLVMSGHVDVRNFGPSKVYYLSQRLPVSAMLSLSYGFIIVLDRMLNVINVNDHFLEFAGVKREDMMYKSFEKFAFPVEFEPSIMPEVRGALAGKESSVEALYKKDGSESYFNVRFIPMVMDDGEKGVAIFFEDITGKKKIENAVRDSEFKFRSIIEQTLNGITLIDQQGKIIEFNPALEHITGLKRDEVLGKEIWDTNLIDPYYSKDNSKLTKRKQQIQAYLKTGKSSVDRGILDRKIIRPDGMVREVQVILFSIKADGGYLLCLVYKDITKGKKMERDLRLSEEKFRVLVDSTDAGIVIMDDFTPVEANSAAERILGYRKDELISKSLKDIIPADMAEKLYGEVESDIQKAKTIGPGARKGYETVAITKSGERRNLVFTVGILKYIGELRWIVTFYDITPFISLKKELKDSEERYQMLAETAEDSIFIISADLKVKYVNPYGVRFLGKPEPMITGTNIEDLFPPEASTIMIGHLREVVNTGNSITSETSIKLSDREIWCSTKLTPIIENGAVTSIMGIMRDITADRRMEEMLRKTQLSVDNSSDLIIWHEADGKITYVNKATCDKLGYTMDELLSMRLSDIDSDYSPAVVEKVWNEKQRQIGFSIIEAFHKTKDGHVFPVEVHSNLLKFGDKEFFVTTAHDITDWKKRDEEMRRSKDELDAMVKERTMELEIANKALTREIDRRITLNNALTESQRTLSTLISNLPGIAYRCKNDENWTMSFISGGCRDITGYNPEDLIENNKISYEEIVYPDDRDMIRDQIQSAIDRNEPFNITYRIIMASGKIRRVNEQGRGVFSIDGRLVDIEGYITDITDLIDMKFSRDQSEEKYRTLVENISDGIWELDKDLRFVYMSPRIYDILGFRPEDAIGKTPYELMLPNEGEHMRQALAPLHETPKQFSFLKCFLKHKNGSRVMVDISGTPFFNERHELLGYRGVTRKIVS